MAVNRTIRSRYLILTLLLAETVLGCRYGLHARKRRSLDESDDELDARIASFFEECLRTAAENILPSLKTTVQFAIRDTQWYTEVRNKVCADERDVPECWVSTLAFFIDTRSPLFAPTAQCVCDFAGDCWSLPKQGYKPEVNHTISVAKPIPLFNQCPPATPDESLTKVEESFSSCLTAKSRRTYSPWSLPERTDGKSITIFLDHHYTYCRRSLVTMYPYDERMLFTFLYLDKLCPREGQEASWRKKVVVTFEDCVKEKAPIDTPFVECKAEISKKFGKAFVTDQVEEDYSDVPPPGAYVDDCLLVYGGKCFKMTGNAKRELNVKGFERQCAKSGGQLANFYDARHLDSAMAAIRSSRNGKDTHLITAMKFDKKRRQLLYSDGRHANFLPMWRPQNPTSHPTHTTVRLFVDRDAEELAQGLYNRAPEFTRHYALCEFQL